MDVIVVGGGAAGMMAAAQAALCGANVTLIEKNEKTGKKIYITGKGRCNVTNNCGNTEFLENAIVYSVVPFGFFNLEGVGVKNLSVSPSIPQELTFWRMENLMYNGVRYDLEAGKDYIILESVRGNTSNMKLTVNLKTDSSEPKVYVNGSLLDESKYTVKNGVVTLTVDFKAQKIQVK